MKTVFMFLVLIFSGAGKAQYSLTQPTVELNAHDWSIMTIRQYRDRQNQKYDKIVPGHAPLFSDAVAIYCGLKKECQKFSISPDGKVDSRDMSAEDAFLLLSAEKMNETLEADKIDDVVAWKEAQAKASLAPTTLKTSSGKYSIQSLPDWPNRNGRDGTVVADTACSINRIRLIENQPDKQQYLLHELMHVATNCSEAPGLHQSIYRLAPSLLKIMRDNPDMVKYLMTPIKGQERN